MVRRQVGRKRDGRPKPPRWLAAKAARALWDQLHGDLTAVRFLETTDHAALARYCQYMAEWVDLTDQIAREGWTYTTSSEHVEDMKRPNPAVRFRAQIETNLKALEDAMGLNPRYRMAITQALLSITARPAQRDMLDAVANEGPDAAPDVADPATEWEAMLADGVRPN